MRALKADLSETQISDISFYSQEKGKFDVELVYATNPASIRFWNGIIAKYHYLGICKVVGRVLRYFIVHSSFSAIDNYLNQFSPSEIDKLVGIIRNHKTSKKSTKNSLGNNDFRFAKGVLEEENNPFHDLIGLTSLSSAVFFCGPRDELIGLRYIPRKKRGRLLANIANNWRFLILPHIHIKNLASHILSKFVHLAQEDWLAFYGDPLFAIESFVEADRFEGTCYQANRWVNIGLTKGLTRHNSPWSGSFQRKKTNRKHIYMRFLNGPSWQWKDVDISPLSREQTFIRNRAQLAIQYIHENDLKPYLDAPSYWNMLDYLNDVAPSPRQRSS